MYESFENGDYIEEKNISLVTNYISGNLISWSPNCSYYNRQYNCATKLYHVCKWRKERGFRPIAKKGESICNSELAIFLLIQNTKNVFAQLLRTI